MNLLQFLAVGQSFVGVKNAPSPYRLAKQNWLPKFAPPSVSSVPVQTRTGATTSKGVGPADSGPKLDPAPLNNVCPIQALSNTPTQERKLTRSLLPGCRSTIKSMVRLRQGELSLDTVTVVRNDLSDTDWEIVPKRPVASKRARSRNPQVAAAPPRVVAEPSGFHGWFKSLFRAGRGLFIQFIIRQREPGISP